MSPSLRDYDAARYGPFLGISDDGSAAEAIAAAALESPKARALGGPDPLAVGVGHDAERLGSVGEVPVGPAEYGRIQAGSAGRVLLTTNVGSHVNAWHFRQPPARDVSAADSAEQVAAWARENEAGARSRDPQPWLRLRFEPGMEAEAKREVVRGAAAEAPVAVLVRSEDGVDGALEAIAVAAEGGASAVVVDGAVRPPTETRPASPGILNYYSVAEARALLAAARAGGVAIEPALKLDTDSISNQIWSGLHAARAMGAQLGKYGLFPLTLVEAERVVRRIQGWTSDWSAAPAVYLDAPALDGTRVYELAEAATSARRWLELLAGAGASIVLVDTFEKSRGLHLAKRHPDDEAGILSWVEIDALEALAAELELKLLWAGGISLAQVREFGRRRPFGVYVTSAVSSLQPARADESDIGLREAKTPMREKVALAKLLLEAGFFGDEALEADARAAEDGDAIAAERLGDALTQRWRGRFGEPAEIAEAGR